MSAEDIQNELEVLAAIYDGDYETRPPLWNQPCFAVKLRPTGKEVYCKCVLKFNLPKNYPKVIPKVDVESSEGLGSNELKDLNAKILDKAKASIGEVMCHEIISMVQEFLEERNLKPVTFYEEMINREKRESEALMKLKYDTSNSTKAEPTETVSRESVITEPSQVHVNVSKGDAPVHSGLTSAATFKNVASPARRKSNPPAGPEAVAPAVVPEKAPPPPLPQIEVPNKDEIVRQSSGPSTGQPTPPKSSWLQMFVNQKDEDDDGDLSSEGERIHRMPSSNDEGDGPVGAGEAPMTTTETSRYKLEFIELSLLGSGASGEVWKAKNKLDRRLYAVKKINLNARANQLNYNKIRREVTTISGLLHKYIVRYYAAWIEQRESFGDTLKEGRDGEEEGSESGDSFGFSRSQNNTGNNSKNSSPQRSSRRNEESSILADIDHTNRLEKLINKPSMTSAFSFNYLSDDLFDREADSKKPPAKLNKNHRNISSAEISFVNSLDLSNGFDSSEGLDHMGYDHHSVGADLSVLSRSSSTSSSKGDDSSSSSSDSYSDNDGEDNSSSSDSYSDNNDDDDEDEEEDGVDLDDQMGDENEKGSDDGSHKKKNSKHSDKSGGVVGIAHQASPKICRYLFIQMEYCCSTLREVIDRGSLWQQPADIMKLLKQLLEALSYIHGRRVIHRDLKPANIFIDLEGNIKVGDFGLATSGKKKFGSTLERINSNDDVSDPNSPLPPMDQFLSSPGKYSAAHHGHSNHSHSLNASNFSDTLTGGIGTAMYSAPEQIFDSTADLKQLPKSSRDKAYNEKADMFSLGIILFEMCHKPFDTGMERFIVLTALRTKGELPSYFKAGASDGKKVTTDNEALETLRSTILWLVHQEPSKRPSAIDLLASSLISNKNDNADVYLREITEALCKPNTTAANNVLSVLFNQRQFAIDQAPASVGRAFQELQLGGIDSTVDDKKGSGKTNALTDAGDDDLGLNNNLFVNDQAISFELKALQNALKLLHPRIIHTSSAVTAVAKSVAGKKTATAPLPITVGFNHIAVTLQYVSALKKLCSHVFEGHGAVEYAPSLLQLRSTSIAEVLTRNKTNDKGNDSNPIAQYLDPTGAVVTLPTDLISPYAKQAAFLNIRASQRYLVDRVYLSVTSNEPSSDKTNMIGSEHPAYSTEAVYDVILPSLEEPSEDLDPPVTNKVLADVEVLSAASEYLQTLKSVLPEYAIRVGDPRIIDSIIQLCACPSNAGLTASTTTSFGERAKKMLDSIDRVQLLRVLSVAPDCASSQDALSLLTDLQLPKTFEARFIPFFKLLTCQSINSDLNNPIKLLEQLIYEFEHADVMIEVGRQIAADSPTVKRKTLNPVATAEEVTAKEIESEAIKNKAAKSKFPKPNAPEAALIGKSPVAEPLNLNMIGIKPNKRVDAEAPQAKKLTDMSILTKPAITLQSPPVLTALDTFNKKEKKHIRIIFKHFRTAIIHLKRVLTSVLALQQIRDKPTTPSGAVGSSQPSGKNARPRSNSMDEQGKHKNSKAESVSDSTPEDSYTAVPYYNFIIDLSLDPRNKSRSPLCPFSSDGLYFVAEAYLPCHSNLQNNKTTIPLHRAASELTLASLSQEDVMNTATSVVATPATPTSVVVNHSVNVCRRRHKGVSGILAEGGQFDHLIKAYRKYLYSYASTKTTANANQAASGVRLKLDSIVALIVKFETRQQKLFKGANMVKANKIKSEVPNNKLGSLLHTSGSPDVLVVSTSSKTDLGSLELNEQYLPSPQFVSPVLQLLRLYGIRATGYAHQLQGSVPGGMQSLCIKLGITYLIIVNESEPLKSRTSVSVVHCHNDVDSEVSELSMGVKVQLNKLSTYLQTDYRQRYGCELISPHPSAGLRDAQMELIAEKTGEVSAQTMTRVMSDANLIADNKYSKPVKGMASNPSATDISGIATKHTAAVEPVKVFSLVVLDSDSHGETSREKKKKRERDLEIIRSKASVLMHAMWHCCNPYANGASSNAAMEACCNKLVVNLKSVGSKFTSGGQIIAVDIPFVLVRSLNTLIMMKAHLPSVRDEFESLASSDLGKLYRKAMKQLLTELCSYNSASTSESGGTGSSSASSGNKCTSTSMIQLYVYSITDDKVDVVSYCPHLVAGARIA